MIMKRLGSYQKAVLRGIKREGSQPCSIKKGYSHQVKTLLKRGLIRTSKKRLYLTNKGKNIYKKM